MIAKESLKKGTRYIGFLKIKQSQYLVRATWNGLLFNRIVFEAAPPNKKVVSAPYYSTELTLHIEPHQEI